MAVVEQRMVSIPPRKGFVSDSQVWVGNELASVFTDVLCVFLLFLPSIPGAKQHAGYRDKKRDSPPGVSRVDSVVHFCLVSFSKGARKPSPGTVEAPQTEPQRSRHFRTPKIQSSKFIILKLPCNSDN